MSKKEQALKFLDSLRFMILAGSDIEEIEWKRNRSRNFYDFKIRISTSDEIRERAHLIRKSELLEKSDPVEQVKFIECVLRQRGFIWNWMIMLNEKEINVQKREKQLRKFEWLHKLFLKIRSLV